MLSMIGAIVGEYFGGPTNALGVSILNDTQLFDFPRAWAGIVARERVRHRVLRGRRAASSTARRAGIPRLAAFAGE